MKENLKETFLFLCRVCNIARVQTTRIKFRHLLVCHKHFLKRNMLNSREALCCVFTTTNKCYIFQWIKRKTMQELTLCHHQTTKKIINTVELGSGIADWKVKRGEKNWVLYINFWFPLKLKLTHQIEYLLTIFFLHTHKNIPMKGYICKLLKTNGLNV